MSIKRLLNGNVLVRKVKKEENQTSSGIIILSSAKTTSCQEVEIVQLPEQVGDGADYEVGDKAYIGLYAGVECKIDDEDLLIIHLQDIILIV